MQRLYAIIFIAVFFAMKNAIETYFLGGQNMPVLALIAMIVVLVALVLKLKKLMLWLGRKQPVD